MERKIDKGKIFATILNILLIIGIALLVGYSIDYVLNTIPIFTIVIVVGALLWAVFKLQIPQYVYKRKNSETKSEDER